MGEHRGKILEEAIREKGYTFTSAAKRAKISRRTLYNYFEDPDLSMQKIAQIDEVLVLGLDKKFTNLSNYDYLLADSTQSSTDESSPTYWRKKYIELLEKYTKLLEKDL